MPTKTPERPRRETLPRPRCPNCHRRFDLKRATQKFCGDNCRKEYHRYGGAVPKVRDAVLKQLPALIREEIARERAALDRLLIDAQGERRELQRLVVRAETARKAARA